MFIVKFLRFFILTVVVLFIVFQIKFMPSYEGQLKYRGYNVTISRDDTYNIPTIKGETKLAAFYGLGYATAEDRLFQLHMKRMLGKGRLAQMVGEKGIDLDIFFRQLGIGYISRQSVELMKSQNPIGFQAYQAYADGVNAYAKRSGLGVQFYMLWTDFEPWQVEDTFVIFKLTDWVQSADGGLTVARELLAQEVGREQAQQILGWKEEHYILVNESTMMRDEELIYSGQSKLAQQFQIKQTQQEQNHDQEPDAPSDQHQTTIQQDQKQQQIKQVQQNQQIKQQQNQQQIQQQQSNNEISQVKQAQITQTIQPKQPTLPTQILQTKQTIQQPQQITNKQQSDQTHEDILQRQEHVIVSPPESVQTNQKTTNQQQQKETEIEEQIPQTTTEYVLQNNKKVKIEEQLVQEANTQTSEKKETDTLNQQQNQNQNQNYQLNQNNQTKEPIQFKEIEEQFLNVAGGGASNSWVISGEHTKSGRPILANDPHLATAIPSDWFQAQLQYPHQGKNITFKGAFIAGTSVSAPVGRANYIAWGCTTQYKDTQDFYKEKVQGNKYFVDGEWKNLNQRQERIRVKGGEDKILTISQTHRGPMLSKIAFLERLYNVPGNVSFAWTGLHTRHDFLSIMIDIIEADSYDQVLSKFASLDYGPAMNVVYMTRDDQIGYQSIGRVPKRKGANSPFFYDGTTTQNDWDGYITGRDKLFLNNPQKGFIVTANSRPASSNFKPGYYDTNFQVTSRQYRITKILQEKLSRGQKLDIQDSISIQLDNIDEYCLYILPYLMRADSRFSLFKDWGCNFSSQSYQASIYEAFFLKLQHKLYTHNTLNIYGFLLFNHYTYKYIISSVQNQEQSQINKITSALTEAYQMLEAKFKTSTKQAWKWGQLHLTFYPHLPFTRSSFKSIFDRYHISSGSLNTPNMGKMTKLHEDNFNCQHHASLRLVLTYQPGQSQWVIDTGISSYPFSNHYDDQELLHKQGKYINFDFNSKYIESNSIFQL